MVKGWRRRTGCRIEAFDDCKVGRGHGCRSTGGGDTSEGSFEVVLIGSQLSREARVGLGRGSRRQAGGEGRIVELADGSRAEEVDAGGDKLVQFRGSVAGRVATATRSRVEKEHLEQQKKLPERIRRGGMVGRRWVGEGWA